MSFIHDYFNVLEGQGEVAICCPFDHVTPTGIKYKETNASASVNTTTRLWNCLACGKGGSEASLIKDIFGCSYIDAKKIQRCFDTDEDVSEWQKLELHDRERNLALSLGISAEVIDALQIKTPNIHTEHPTLCFPVLMYDHLVDIRSYCPEAKPKVKSRTGCPSGLIIPYDLWREKCEVSPNTWTLICAGEKDMAVARSNNLNAITFTGGENTTPKILEPFRGKKIAILYDNDTAGIEGAKKLAMTLTPYAEVVKVVTNFHEVCKEPKEDITDFFVKYQKTRNDLVNYILETPAYVPTTEDLQNNYPEVTLIEASRPDKLNRLVRSNIQVIAVSEGIFAAHSAIMYEKVLSPSGGDRLAKGDIKEWELTADKCQDIIHLIDNGFKEDIVTKNIKMLCKVPYKETGMKMHVYEKKTVYKVHVTDMYETNDKEARPLEFTAYSIGHKLESGCKYLVTHKIVPHPYKGQQLVMLITDAIQANDSVSDFRLTTEDKLNLKIFRDLEGTVEERINLLTEKVKGLLGYNGNNTLIQAIDLSYHTVLQFDFGSFKKVRGYLDTIIVGESRVGKSSTADALRTCYKLGTFTSLAGNSATIPGLVGGSNKTSGGSFQTRAGIIPQNHKGLIIFEEFGKSKQDVITELTDIRSSNEVRITRVSGTITMPALVRMIALTNVKSINGAIKPIASYPNGISVLTELVPTAEDIARYDLIVILSDRGNAQIDPFWEPEKPLDEEAYRARVRWVWSRTTEQIVISREVGLYIMEHANALNKTYECHIKIFGTEAWKKITRLAIAVAGYLVSTDDEYETIIVTKDHVDYAVAYMVNLYDNSTFKLREYVQHERRYSQIDEDGVACLQDIYNKCPGLVLQLEQSASTSRNTLGASSGLSSDDLNKALSRLTKGYFIRYQAHDIIPTERFRLGLARVNKETSVSRIGE